MYTEPYVPLFHKYANVFLSLNAQRKKPQEAMRVAYRLHFRSLHIAEAKLHECKAMQLEVICLLSSPEFGKWTLSEKWHRNAVLLGTFVCGCLSRQCVCLPNISGRGEEGGVWFWWGLGLRPRPVRFRRQTECTLATLI